MKRLCHPSCGSVSGYTETHRCASSACCGPSNDGRRIQSSKNALCFAQEGAAGGRQAAA
ncbi:protein of unknown function (plasmid) [Azospirillum baldaniorum]|uniref:Uncharacterized protein n=1 Tax=Azospirillum baldaniorum TaxID=1064539 RepID=A0A9P1JXS3_9PROT|nr:protein of unknown function [Azospirillum baldaniorum]